MRIIAPEAIIQAETQPFRQPMNRPIILVLIAALAAGAGLALSSRLFNTKPEVPAMPALETVTVIQTPRALKPFILESALGKISAEQLKGHWTLIFIGFSHCPDICPTTLSELALVQNQLTKAGLPNPPKVLFVSVDPERDSPALLADYAAYFHKDTLTATASQAPLSAFTQDLGLVYMKVPQGDSYTMDHSATLVLLNPAAEFAGIVRPPLKPTALARDLITLAKARP